MVEHDAPGFSVSRIEPKMGIKGSTTGELLFDGCRVPAGALVGEEGSGFRTAMRVLDRSRPGIGAQALGIAQAALDYALRYATERETFGKPLSRAPGHPVHAGRHGGQGRGQPRAALRRRRHARRRASTGRS